MKKKDLKNLFINYCNQNNFEKNSNQFLVLDSLHNFYFQKKNILDFFFKKNIKNCFYLYGDVGVGKTMILDFFFEQLDIPKKRIHFKEFMINFHDYYHQNKKKINGNSLEKFVINLKKKYEIIYFDEFQVTNIVDAMILGKLFEVIFTKNLKIIITSNTKSDKLYKDGLQREQFLPFIYIIKKHSIEKELLIIDDYRKADKKLNRFFYPLNETINFEINKLFRKITRGKKKSLKIISIKERNFQIINYYQGIARFDFVELCDRSIGAEDYIKIAEECNFIIIENIPKFSDVNINQQLRFITLIDIFYEKKIKLVLSSELNLKNFTSSSKLETPFKRTISRIYELTSSPSV